MLWPVYHAGNVSRRLGTFRTWEAFKILKSRRGRRQTVSKFITGSCKRRGRRRLGAPLLGIQHLPENLQLAYVQVVPLEDVRNHLLVPEEDISLDDVDRLS